jgi:predicted nucleotidyltransferase
VTDEVLTLEELRRRRAEILGVARRRRAHRVAVLGSVARGEARPDSDLDLLVDRVDPGAGQHSLACIELDHAKYVPKSGKS